MLKKWKKLKEVPYKTNFRKMSKVTFKLPNGLVHDFDIVRGARVASILALTKQDKVIIAKQYRPGPDKVLYEMPAGMIDENESPIKAAARELLEETGYKGQLKLVGKSFSSAYRSGASYSFIAKNCVKVSEPKTDATEFIEVKLISIEQFKNNLKKGLLTDTASGYQALDYLGLL
jgi:ADP-ribose pyrophosphatase